MFVPEPSVAQTIMILRGLRDTLEAHHKVTITDEAVVAAAELSDRYITGRFLPDKAIDLIDQAAARVKISATARPVDVQELEAETRQLKREQDYASSRKKFDRASELQAQHDAKNKELQQATERWRRNLGSGSAEVQSAHIAEVVSKLTGIPVTELTTEERQRLIKLEERLHQRVIGQDEAVKAVSDAVRLARAGLREGRRPTATFLFLGPTGVGKTELAKALAEAVYGDEDAMIRLDMSEYMERHTVARLIGAPPGYVGYEEGGQLTERVRRRPYSVVLLDEIEKAHSDVYNVLLQVFDDGRLTDGKGRVVDFTNTIIIATSNLGADIIQRHLRVQGAASDEKDKLRRELMDVLRMHFRPEFLNRIDEIIVFHALDRKQIRDIVDLQLERVKRTAHGQGIELEVDESLIEHLAAAGFRPEFGARELRRQIRSELETELARAMLGDEVHEGDRVLARWDGDEQKVSFEPVREAKPADLEGHTETRQTEPEKGSLSLMRAPSATNRGAGHRPGAGRCEPPSCLDSSAEQARAMLSSRRAWARSRQAIHPAGPALRSAGLSAAKQEKTMTNTGINGRTPGGRSPAHTEAMNAVLARNWWLVALRGVLAIIFGLFAILFTGPTMLSLVLVFSAYMLVDGAFAIAAAIRAARANERWGLLVLEGIADIAAGIIAFLWPDITVLAFVLVIAAWAIVSGGLMWAAAYQLRRDHGRWWLVVGGVISVIYGALLVVAPLIGAIVLTWWIGAYALVFGGALLVLAFRLRVT